jgi:hypothetical protein
VSADKRKRWNRACARLREINCGDYSPAPLDARDARDPVIRYIVRKGMARIVRVAHGPAYGGYTLRRTKLDTGFPWARQNRPRAPR